MDITTINGTSITNLNFQKSFESSSNLNQKGSISEKVIGSQPQIYSSSNSSNSKEQQNHEDILKNNIDKHKQIVDSFNQSQKDLQVNYSWNKTINGPMVTVVDKSTKEVIQQIPSKATLQFLENLQNNENLTFIKTKI